MIIKIKIIINNNNNNIYKTHWPTNTVTLDVDGGHGDIIRHTYYHQILIKKERAKNMN